MVGKRTNSRSGACHLGTISQLKDLPDATLQRLEAVCRVRPYDPEQTVIHSDDEPNYVGFVKQGVLRMQKTLPDGREHIVGLLVEGDMFGRLYNGPMHFGIEAATWAELCMIPRPAFEALLADSPELDRLIFLNMLNELDRARDWMIILANQRITGRIAGFLLVLCTRFQSVDHILRLRGGAIEIQMPISRADLSHLLGTRPESISRAFHALEHDGTIKLVRSDLIRIVDPEALVEAAGDDRYVANHSLRELVQILQSRE
ncbi:Crp/Fnr family transcriptional regulator [Tranquillimonas rosea]|uniref:Crp/Fnr family transcriptional regulator n=1 Tax=Tranquillimonas rosea TaxID=641238 RepID=UPI003BA8694F